MTGAIFIDNQTPKVKRGRGRPRKDPNSDVEPQIVLKDAAAAAFRKAKSEYEKDLPYKLNHVQFMMVLITAFSKNQ